MSLDMRLENAEKFYLYEASIILMKAVIRWANRYATLAREMVDNEKDETRKEELIAIAETCEHVPEHPARNMREVMQAHWFAHLAAELEQIGCGYSEGYLGQNLEPYFQADKAAGLIDYDAFRDHLIAEVARHESDGPGNYWAAWQDAFEAITLERGVVGERELAIRATAFAEHT